MKDMIHEFRIAAAIYQHMKTNGMYDDVEQQPLQQRGLAVRRVAGGPHAKNRTKPHQAPPSPPSQPLR